MRAPLALAWTSAFFFALKSRSSATKGFLASRARRTAWLNASDGAASRCPEAASSRSNGYWRVRGMVPYRSCRPITADSASRSACPTACLPMVDQIPGH